MPTITAVNTVGEHWALAGTAFDVVDGHSADLLIVSAYTAAGLGLFAVESVATGISISKSRSLDPTRALSTIELNSAEGIALGEGGRAHEYLATSRPYARACLCAEQVGGAQRILDMTVEYVKGRVQFGRPIGSFQAVKHLCADMYTHVESARAVTHYALRAYDNGSPDVTLAVDAAVAVVSDAYRAVTATALQLHGGIGYTWEHDAQLYFKRATSSAYLLGSSSQARERVAVAIGL